MVWSRIPTPSSAISYAIKRTTSFASTPSTTPPAYDEARSSHNFGFSSDEMVQRLAVERLKASAPESPICTAQALLCLQASTELYANATSPQQIMFARELYIQALEALARGVPEGLQGTELVRLQSVFSRLLMQNPDLVPALETQHQAIGAQHTGAQPSTAFQEVLVLLCRTGATAVKFTIPKIKVGLEQAVAYERKYHVLERGGVVFSASVYRVAGTLAKCQLGGVCSSVATALSMGALEAYRILAEQEDAANSAASPAAHV